MTTPTTRWRAENIRHDPAAVKRAREEYGISQSGLAAKVGISRSHMCEIEAGTRDATIWLLPRIARALGCSVDDLKRQPEMAK